MCKSAKIDSGPCCEGHNVPPAAIAAGGWGFRECGRGGETAGVGRGLGDDVAGPGCGVAAVRGTGIDVDAQAVQRARQDVQGGPGRDGGIASIGDVAFDDA